MTEQLLDLDFQVIKDLSDQELENILKGQSQPEIDALKRVVLTAQAQSGDNAPAFVAFYELVFGRVMPTHTIAWVELLYSARERGRGAVIEAFRGSTKTTVLTILFTAWRIGQEPHLSNLLIQVGDDIATDNSAAVANVIEFNTGFRSVFPHVEPDKAKGWGADGYEVKRTDISYRRWREKNSDRKDPTLLGAGYKSRNIIGKHPEGLLIIDDINDENNTASERELAKVRRILTDTIFPTKSKDTWTIFVGTPWVENDIINYVKATGEYDSIKTPVWVKLLDGKVELTWVEKFDYATIMSRLREVGSIGFARMYELDLSASKNKVFKYQSYPASEIRFNWVIQGGCDYAGTMDEQINKSGVNDLFALCYVAKLPGGGGVVVDGVVDHVTQGQAEVYVKRAQKIFPSYLSTVVEADGKGEEFAQVVRRNPKIRIIPEKTGGKGKGIRLEREMSPWLENGMIRVSDADTPFLNELRHELDLYPNCTHDDALDALYWALRGMPDVLVLHDEEESLPEPTKRKRKKNPMVAFGSR
jgi:hypothetical protein